MSYENLGIKLRNQIIYIYPITYCISEDTHSMKRFKKVKTLREVKVNVFMLTVCRKEGVYAVQKKRIQCAKKKTGTKNSIANYALQNTTHPTKTIAGIFSTCLTF
jgi:hypothetical protein